jgi:large subunit ribosomal protein L22
MEAKAVSRNVRMTPRKMRLVANLVRGMKINEALVQLQFNKKAAAVPVSKAVRSAIANYKVKFEGEETANFDNLIVRAIWVDEGPTVRRFLPRAMGRATKLLKRSSHLTVVVGAPMGTVDSGTEA